MNAGELARVRRRVEAGEYDGVLVEAAIRLLCDESPHGSAPYLSGPNDSGADPPPLEDSNDE